MSISQRSGLIGAILIAAVVVIYLLVSPARTEVPTPVVLASPSATATTTTAPAATQAASPTPSPTGLYVNSTYKFSLALPPPYRQSTRAIAGAVSVSSQRDQFAFTARTEADESSIDTSGCHTACPLWQAVAYVMVNPGRASQTLRDFYAKEQGASVKDVIEDTLVDGRPAIKVAPGAVYPMEFIIKDGDRIIVVAYQLYGPENGMAVPAGASKEKLDAILASFKFLQ